MGTRGGVLHIVAAVAILMAPSISAPADEPAAGGSAKAAPPQAVVHLDKPSCPADTLKDLAARRKAKGPAPEITDAAPYRVTRWPALGDEQLAADDVPVEFIEIEKAGACQLLVSDRFAEIVSARLPLPGAPAPQLLISRYSGGAHCCFSYDIVSLGEHIAVDRLETADSPISLVGLGDGGAPDITYSDMAFSYWNASFADSPAGQVRLTWEKDRYRLADPRQMPAPDDAQRSLWQVEMTAAIRAMKGPYVPVAEQNQGKEGPEMDAVIWSHLLDLIYQGYPDLAVDLFKRAWPDDVPGKAAFWRDFVDQLQQASVIWKPWHLAKVLTPDLPKAP